MKYVWLGGLIVYMFLVGYVVRGIVEKQTLQLPVMAYGFQEDKQVWNRIRVNEQGRVLCAKEQLGENYGNGLDGNGEEVRISSMMDSIVGVVVYGLKKHSK